MCTGPMGEGVGVLLWFKTLEECLHDRGFKSSENDLCLILKKDFVDLVYDNDFLFFWKDGQAY